MASKASRAQRIKQNKGVAHGTTRTGAGGKTLRRYNAKTARWDVVSVRADKAAVSRKPAVSSPPKLAGSGKDRVNALTSSGTARTSGSPVTDTKGVKVNLGRQQVASNRRKTVMAVAAAPVPGLSSVFLGRTSRGKSASQAFQKNVRGNLSRSRKDIAKKSTQAYKTGRSFISSAERWWSGY